MGANCCRCGMSLDRYGYFVMESGLKICRDCYHESTDTVISEGGDGLDCARGIVYMLSIVAFAVLFACLIFCLGR